MVFQLENEADLASSRSGPVDAAASRLSVNSDD
jgi:hypothetical protein